MHNDDSIYVILILVGSAYNRCTVDDFCATTDKQWMKWMSEMLLFLCGHLVG